MSTYKDSLRLPRTDFPMKAGLAVREPALLEKWESQNLYRRIQDASKDRPAYILHDGPPFANGDVHMGTALNKILKDFVVKSKTMAGFRAPFVPGWDCHGLPIEFKVVKESRDLSPLEVRKRSAEYALKFLDIQRAQFRRLGVLGDWENPYLTLDPAYEAEILRAFAVFVEKGLVYRSKKPVLWSSGAHTALAEAEVEYKDKVSPSVYVAFALADARREDTDIVIWTTTPWTLPANLAIAVHPRHTYARVRIAGRPRPVLLAEARLPALLALLGNPESEILGRVPGEDLAGAQAAHPFVERLASVYTAEFVTLDSGTGCVHIAPGHGEEDYQLGMLHGLDLLSPVDDSGCFTGECGVPQLVGKYVFDANPLVIGLLAERGALVAKEDYQHTYPHCWRSKTPVIFRAVEQFFIRINELRGDALEAVDSATWIPHWGRNRIRGTVEARPDWCISRQRSWGVPLPVFYRQDGDPILDPELIRRVAGIIAAEGTNAWFAWNDDTWNTKLDLPAGTHRRNDTLDVWIDSGVSHAAVLRTHPELSYPADLYLEATDQHRGWFQSSLMTSVAMNGTAPYRSVLTHGFVVDVDTRRKISKSEQGGYKKPTDAAHYVGKYGADLVRLWVCSVNFTDDIPFSEEIFTRLGDAYRRLRNTLRILLGNLDGFDPARDFVPHAERPLVDRWIAAETRALVAECLDAYEKLEFHRVYQKLTQFSAVELSSLYVDITKDRLYCDGPDSLRRRATQSTMHEVFSAFTRLLAPVLVFTAEEAWGHFNPASDSVHLEPFPKVGDFVEDPVALETGREWLKIRARVAQSVEAAAKDDIVGKPLEARVELSAPSAEFEKLEPFSAEIEEFLILSDLRILPADAWEVKISKTPHVRCERCWRHRADTGSDSAHPALCSRCAEAVGGFTPAVSKS